MSGTLVIAALVTGLVLSTWGMQFYRSALIQTQASQKLADAQRLYEEGQIEESEKLLEEVPPEALQADFTHLELRRNLGDIHAQREEWEAAARNFKCLLEMTDRMDRRMGLGALDRRGALGDTLTLDYLRCRPILIHVGNVQEYDSFRDTLIERSKNLTDHVYVERISRACLLLPADEKTMAAIKRWQKVVERGEDDPNVRRFWKHFAAVSLALMDYWQGNLEDSNAWCESYPQSSRFVRTMLQAISARNYYRLGNEEEARRHLNLAARRIDEVFARSGENRPSLDPRTDDWLFDWYYARILYRQAKELVDRSSPRE